MPRAELIEVRARALLDAMDRQYGQPPFSMNVRDEYDKLRALLPRRLDPQDKSRPPKVTG
jgi:hypothetical protein